MHRPGLVVQGQHLDKETLIIKEPVIALDRRFPNRLKDQPRVDGNLISQRQCEGWLDLDE